MMKDVTQLVGYGANLEPHCQAIIEWHLADFVPPTAAFIDQPIF